MSFELFPELRKEKKLRALDLKEKFKNEVITFEVLNNDIYKIHDIDDNNNRMLNCLSKATGIFQTQLPKMPKEYIHRQVFDPKHRTLVIMEDLKIVGGICYRPFYEKIFAEIVFCAIEEGSQVKGYGGLIMDFFKEHVKSEFHINLSYKRITNNVENFLNIVGSDSLIYKNSSLNYLDINYTKQNNFVHLMTYADNFAIGYFKKNGFSTEIKFRNWVGCIKDYDGGTMMQCKLIWEINYINKEEFLAKRKQSIVDEFSLKSSFNTIRKGIDPRTFKSPFDIPGVKEAKLEDYMLIKKTKEENIRNALKFLLSDLQANSSAWPFMIPVKASEVPDYYTVIKNPMDFSTMEKKIESGGYLNFIDFDMDFKQMIKNCMVYNAPHTLYYKCAQNLDEYYEDKVKIFNFDDRKDKNIVHQGTVYQ